LNSVRQATRSLWREGFVKEPCLKHTLQSNNIVLRILCALHRNEAQKLLSVYHIFPEHSSSIYIKGRLVKFCNGTYNLITCPEFTDFCFSVYIAVMFSCCLFCSSLFLNVFIVYLYFVFFLLLCCLIWRNKE